MKLFTRGDWEGFFAAFINNLVQLLILAPLCILVLGFSPKLVFGTILPGVAISFLLGNLFYASQAIKLAKKEGRNDVCALPYGISTPGLFAHIFLVMLPAKLLAESQGLPNPERIAWQAGLVATLTGGFIEFSMSFFAAKIRSITPRAAMLSTLAGVGLGFLGLGFLFQSFASPIVGMVTIALVFLAYFGKVQFVGKIPATLIILFVGTSLCWIIGLAPVGAPEVSPWAEVGIHFPKIVIFDLIPALSEGHVLPYLSVIIPISFLGVLASLQNIESAAAAGDDYPVKSSYNQRNRHHGSRALRISLPHVYLYWSPGMESTRLTCRLLRSQRSIYNAGLLNRNHVRFNMGYSGRGWIGDNFMDRNHNNQSSL